MQADDEMPMLAVKTLTGLRSPSNDELERAASILNEQNVFSVRIYCRNPACKDKGSWIMRPVEELKRNAYACEICKHPMER